MPESFPLLDRYVIGVDVQGYSPRSTRRQQSIQRDLDALLSEAAQAAGLERSRWDRQGTGDGELAVLPPDVDLAAVVGRFISELSARLASRNEDHVPDMWIRLRVGIHSDAIIRSASDSRFAYAGPALVHLSRLLNSPEIRHTLARAQQAALVLIVSEPVHRKVVESGLGGIRAEQFCEVRVVDLAKRFDESAYVHVPGYDMHTFERVAGGDAGEGPEAPGEPSRGRPSHPSGASAVRADNSGQVTTIFGGVRSENVEIGTMHVDRRGRRL